MGRPPLRGWPAYGAALAAIVVATLARMALDPILKGLSPFVTYFLGAIPLFLITGLGPAMFEAVVGGLAGYYFFVAPRRSFAPSTGGVLGLTLYLFTVGTTLLLLRSLRRAQAEAERKRAKLIAAEAVVRAQRETWRATLASIADAVVAADREGRVTFLNGVAERLTGRSLAESIGRPLAEVVPLSGPGGHPAGPDLAGAVRGGEVFGPSDGLELADRSRSGAMTLVEVVASPIRGEVDGDGEALGVVVVLRDVSAAHRVAAELGEAKEAAEAANRAKDRFLAAISHELRTPLAPVMLGVSYIMEGGLAPGPLLPTFEMIRRNVEQEARLIDDLIDVVQIRRGVLVGSPRPVDAHALIREAVADCRALLDRAGVAPSLALDAVVHRVVADPDRFRQAIVNLLKNAAKFSPGGGRVAIRTYREPPESVDPDAPGRLVVEVADTGVGIAPEALPTIFLPFDQGRRAGADRGGGLGLGLAICRAILAGAGGTIEASSPGPGLGASFTLKLDARPGPVPARDAIVPPPLVNGTPALGALRVLVVEDDEPSLRAISQAVGGLGHRVTTAGSVASAAALAHAPIDLLLSDIGLPDGTGHDVLRNVLAAGPVRAIALSGFGLDEDIRRSRAAGFAEHLIKPVDLRTLDAAIRRVMGTA